MIKIVWRLKYLTWEILYDSFAKNPRNIKTHPLSKAMPKWFYAYSNGSAICIENARGKQPSCALTATRKLEHDKFTEVYEIYLRRETGDSVSKEITKITQQSSYWYGVINAFVHGK